MDDVTAFVLAGGKGSRMGADKALLPLGNENLLQRAMRTVAAACPNPMIVGNRDRYESFGDVVEDRMPGCGPLGGIHAALSGTRSDRNLILSVDTPMMTAEFLRWLLSQSANDADLATVPQSGGRTQPLCAIYRRDILPVIERSLAAGEYKVDRIFMQVATRYVANDEIHAAGFDDEIFHNINTPDEYELMKRRFAGAVPAGVQGLRR